MKQKKILWCSLIMAFFIMSALSSMVSAATVIKEFDAVYLDNSDILCDGSLDETIYSSMTSYSFVAKDESNAPFGTIIMKASYDEDALLLAFDLHSITNIYQSSELYFKIYFDNNGDWNMQQDEQIVATTIDTVSLSVISFDCYYDEIEDLKLDTIQNLQAGYNNDTKILEYLMGINITAEEGDLMLNQGDSIKFFLFIDILTPSGYQSAYYGDNLGQCWGEINLNEQVDEGTGEGNGDNTIPGYSMFVVFAVGITIIILKIGLKKNRFSE